MDTFMDKLAQKLNAQEMIKANSAADAAELSRIREQNAEYDALIKKIKESSEGNAQNAVKLEKSIMQVAEHTERAAQNIEQTARNAEMTEQNARKAAENAVRIEQSAELVERNAELVERNAAKVEANALKIEELVAAGISKIEEMQAAGQNTEELNGLLAELKKVQAEQFDTLTDHVHKENVKVYRNVQAVVVEELAKQNETVGKTLEAVSKKIAAVVGISVVAMLAAAAGLVFQILACLHII